MTYLPIQMDTAGSSDSQVAMTGWMLPSGSWLVPNGTGRVFVVVSGSKIEPKVRLTVEPANGHHSVAACVASSSEVPAA